MVLVVFPAGVQPPAFCLRMTRRSKVKSWTSCSNQTSVHLCTSQRSRLVKFDLNECQRGVQIVA